jgi:hypothetical protein
MQIGRRQQPLEVRSRHIRDRETLPPAEWQDHAVVRLSSRPRIRLAHFPARLFGSERPRRISFAASSLDVGIVQHVVDEPIKGFGGLAGVYWARNPEQASRFRLKGDNKMKRVLGITFAVFALAAIAFGADNTLGTWKYNTAKSKQAPGVSAH